MNNREWFKQAGYGMMIHFGLYSLIGGEWRGARMPFIGEWAQSYFRIPGSEYGQLRQAFNPLLFEAEEWVKTAKDAGMQYMVVTSKHHDGFCLFHTKWDDYNVVDGTPFKRDIIEELANACARHGLKLGLYYSEELDWHEPDGGGYGARELNCGCMSWTNDWDFPDNAHKNYARLFETPATLNDTWGYKSFDENWKSAEEVLRLKRHLNVRGINYLLNVGPDPMGRIPAPAQEILRRVGTLG